MEVRSASPRTVLARALNNLLDADAKVIGLDIDFIDPAPQNPRDTALLEALNAETTLPESLQPLRDELEARIKNGPDEALEAAFKKGGRRIVQGVIPYRKADLAAFLVVHGVLDGQGRAVAQVIARPRPGKKLGEEIHYRTPCFPPDSCRR